MSTAPFLLHVDSNLDYPIQEDGTVSYGPLRVVKLEGHKIATVHTGIRLVDCKRSGKVVIVPYREYEGILKFCNCEYRSGDTGIMSVEISNLTDDFIRIEQNMHLFSFTYVEDDSTPTFDQSAEPKQELNQEEQEEQELKQEEQEESKQAEPKQAEPKQEEPKQEEPKQEEPKQEELKQEEPKQEEPKQEELKHIEKVAIKAEQKKAKRKPSTKRVVKVTV